ncbi:MAG: Dps family protein [Janthinobacterium lividum]
MTTTAHKSTTAAKNGHDADGTPAQTRSEGFPKTYPAPPQLSTPTDLTSEQAKAVTDAVNPLIADAFALYAKTKNFHWHLSGPRFRDLHLLFDKQATQIFESIDPMVERLRKIGGTSIRSLSHVGQLQTIHDDNDEFVDPQEMVHRLMLDNRHIAQQLREAAEVADDNKDIATSNLLETYLDDAERRTWFLFEIYQNAEAVH